MKRRTFLKITGMSSASAMLAGCQKSNEKLIPFLVPPEDGVLPGTANYYASTCRQCPAGCGILVRVSEGRAKKIEGNPEHPVNRGKLCARGQAALQELYHPDRVRHPLERVGPRGAGRFRKISWEEAIGQLTDQLDTLRAQAGNRLAVMTPPVSGSLAILIDRFMKTFPAADHLAWDLHDPEWLRRGSLASYGSASLPDFDLENTQYILSFGADFLDSHLSPVRYGRGFGAMRQARPTIRGRFTYAGARMSLTAASADRWLATRPGTDGLLALGLARELLERGSCCENTLAAAGLDKTTLASHLSGFTARWVIEACGISHRDFMATADDLAEIRPAVVMAGEAVAWQSNGLEAVKAVHLLNIMTASVDRDGGLFLPSDRVSAKASRHTELLDLTRRMRNGEYQLGLLWRTNPVYNLPASLGFSKALEKLPFLVSFSPFLDDTTQHADLVLPDHADLESWGDVYPDRGLRKPVAGLLQPVVKPQHDTRLFADVLLAVGRQYTPRDAGLLPWQTYPELVKATLQDHLPETGPAAFDVRWEEARQQGGCFDLPAGGAAEPRPKAELPLLRDARFHGDPETYPLHLQVYASPTLYDGRSAHLPWLQQMPDPMSTAVWGSWVEINPTTAGRRGIRQGDLVEVTSPVGSTTLPAVIYPGIHPDMLAIPIGQGHAGYGRYADKRGVNPLHLLMAAHDDASGLPAWAATRVQLRRLSAEGGLVTAGHPQGSYRRDILNI